MPWLISYQSSTFPQGLFRRDPEGSHNGGRNHPLTGAKINEFKMPDRSLINIRKMIGPRSDSWRLPKVQGQDHIQVYPVVGSIPNTTVLVLINKAPLGMYNDEVCLFMFTITSPMSLLLYHSLS